MLLRILHAGIEIDSTGVFCRHTGNIQAVNQIIIDWSLRTILEKKVNHPLFQARNWLTQDSAFHFFKQVIMIPVSKYHLEHLPPAGTATNICFLLITGK